VTGEMACFDHLETNRLLVHRGYNVVPFDNSQVMDYKALGTVFYNVNAKGAAGVGGRKQPIKPLCARFLKIFERIAPALTSYG